MDSKSQSSLAKKMVLPLVFFSAAAGADVTLYGHVNRAMLYANDDHESHWYSVDNDNSASRLGVKMSYEQSNDIQVGGLIEFSIESVSSNRVSQLQRDGALPNAIVIRHADAWISNPTWGKLSVGQGSMAADGTAESSYSGTQLVIYNTGLYNLSDWVFHRDGFDGAAINGDPTIDSVFTDYDGLSRQDRLRYDTPTWYGFSFSTSFAQVAATQSAVDVAIRYSGEWMNNFAVKGAVAHTWRSSGANNANGTGGILNDDSGYKQHLTDGSFAVMHNPTGWNGAFAIGAQQKASNRLTTTNNGQLTTKHAKMWSVEIGKQSEWIACGNTNVSVQYVNVDDVRRDDDDGHSWGVGVVQHLDRANTELYAGLKNFSYKEPIRSYDDIWSLMVGLRVRFSAGL